MNDSEHMEMNINRKHELFQKFCGKLGLRVEDEHLKAHCPQGQISGYRKKKFFIALSYKINKLYILVKQK